MMPACSLLQRLLRRLARRRTAPNGALASAAAPLAGARDNVLSIRTNGMLVFAVLTAYSALIVFHQKDLLMREFGATGDSTGTARIGMHLHVVFPLTVTAYNEANLL